jgi:hypothetical protein
MIPVFTLKPAMNDLEAEVFAGKLLDESSYDLLIDESADVLGPDGRLLAKFRRGAIPEQMRAKTFEALKDAATPSQNRGIAAGENDKGETDRKRIRKDGVPTRTRESAKPVNSGIVGFFDRYTRTPYCRLTAYTMDNREKFLAAIPFLQFASDEFRREVPDRWSNQNQFVEKTHPDFRIPGTAFTTVTVNSNWQTATHQDAGDLRQGFGVMATLGHDYDGCHLVFPQYRVAFRMKPGDLIFDDVHQWHGNTPLKLTAEGGERLSLVLYYREKMISCGSASEELERAKNRQPGDRIKEDRASLFDGIPL